MKLLHIDSSITGDQSVTRRLSAAVVESVKAASDVYSPASGEVVAINDALGATPGAINEEAEGKGWFFRLKLSSPDELNDLMSAEQYKEFLASLE